MALTADRQRKGELVPVLLRITAEPESAYESRVWAFQRPSFLRPVFYLYLRCAPPRCLQKRDFLYETGFLPGLKFSTSHFICVLSILLFSFWIDWPRTKRPRFRGPYLKSRQMRWYTYIQTYLHPKISNEAGLGHRQPRLVTYATWISLLWSLFFLATGILKK